MHTTKLGLQDSLPLTCTRTGTCCHGKQVWLNPWELFCIAKQKEVSPRKFRDLYCEFGGIRLRFNGTVGPKNQKACSQYIDGFGCSVHLGRPLACRLYPLGRQIQNNEANYMFQGVNFPCLEGCPDVTDLPHLTVGQYLEGQETDRFEKAQDTYLEMMQNIADIAFELLLDSGLSESGDTKTIPLWREMGNEAPQVLADRIGNDWMDSLMLPDIQDETEDPISFARQQNELIQLKAQDAFGALQTAQELHEASVLIMGVALNLARAIGADPKELSEHWIEIAKSHGAQE